MKKIIEYVKQKKWLHYLIIMIIGFLIALPIIHIDIDTTDDGWTHFIRLISLDKSISDGKFPYLVSPYLCRNFGYSMVSMYPPIVAYIPYIIGQFTNSYMIALKVFASLTIGLSGIFMYKFMNEVTKNNGIAFLASCIYMVIPYRLEVIFNRYAIGEFTAFIFMPMVFQGLYNLLNGDRKKHFYIAIGAIGLLLSHTISTVYTALFCVIYILFNFKKFMQKDVIIKCIINIVWIILITAFFIVPLMEFENEAHYTIFEPTRMRTNGLWTSKNTIELWQFIKDKDEVNRVSFILGIPSLIMLCITILSYKYIDKEYKSFYITNWLLAIISVFMCTKFFPWVYMPQVLNNIQYPWRLVGFAMFFFTPVFSMNIYYLIKSIKNEKIGNVFYFIFIVFLGIFTIIRLNIYEPTKDTREKEKEEMIRNNPVISHFNVARDYLPVKAITKQSTYLMTRENRVYVINGDANISNENKNALVLTFNIDYGEENSVLELPYYFYPGYIATLEIDGQKEKIEIVESENGFLQITLLKDVKEGAIRVEYTGTILEKIAYLVSFISIIAFIIYIFYIKRKEYDGELNETKD